MTPPPYQPKQPKSAVACLKIDFKKFGDFSGWPMDIFTAASGVGGRGAPALARRH